MNMVFGDNGLVKKAEQAKNMTEEAVQKEQGGLANVAAWLNEIIYGEGSGGDTGANEETPGTNSADTNGTDTNTDTNSTETNSIDTNSVDANSVDTNTVEPPPVEEIPDGEEEGAIIFGAPTWNGGKANVTISTETEYKIEYQINKKDEGSWTELSLSNGAGGTKQGTVTGLNNNDTIYARLTDGTNYGKETSITIKDSIAPQVTVTPGTITSSTIKVEIETVDNESGMQETVNYTYYIKKSTEGDASYKNSGTNTNANFTFTGLEQGTNYDIKVEAQGDKAGNMGVGILEDQTTKSLPGGETGLEQGAIKFGTPIWTNGTASVMISTNTSYTIEYQKGTGVPEDGSWQTIANNGNVAGLNHNETVYARLTDGVNYGEYASITIKDTEQPSIEISEGEITHESIEISVTANDNESGLAAENTYKYYLNDEEKASTTDKTYIFTGLVSETSYNIKVEVYDKAGNKGEKTTIVETTKKPAYIDNILPTAPEVSEGMIPVKYDESTKKWVKTDNADAQWYNYEDKKWANVVLGEAKFNEDGTLNEDEPYSMLVWIPRYAYKITTGWHQSGEDIKPTYPATGAGNIEVVFINEENQDKAGKTYNGVYDSSNGTYSDYVVHPAFNYGNSNENKLKGFWIGKFETSNTNCTTDSSTGAYNGTDRTIQIKANVTAWRGLTASNTYTVCTELNKAGNIYGLNSNDGVVDPHMIKNIEWGAVAYLSKTKYGVNSEVYVNNNYDYITGIGGNSVDADSTSAVTNNYKTGNGQKASTTGNTTGVYDMSGGSYEIVAAYINNGNSSLSSYGSKLLSAEARYKDVYSKGSGSENASGNYIANAKKYGDAVYETSTQDGASIKLWYSNYSYYPETSKPFFTRGDYMCYDGDNPNGIFSFDRVGNVNNSVGFRICIPVI